MKLVTSLTPGEGCLFELIKWGLIIAVVVGIGCLFVELIPILIAIGIIILIIYIIRQYLNQKSTEREQQGTQNYINQIAPRDFTYWIQLHLSSDDSYNLGGDNVQYMFINNNHVISFPEGNNLRYYLIHINFTPTFSNEGELPTNAVLTFITVGTHQVIKIAPKMYKQDVVTLEEHFLLSNYEINELGL